MTSRSAQGSADKTAAFFGRIQAHQSKERRSTNEIMGNVLATYLPTAHDRKLNDQIDWLFDTMLLELGQQPGIAAPAGQIRGGRALVVVGEAGAGKSRAISHALLTRPEFEGFGKKGEWSPVVSVVAPSPFTLGALGNEIVRKLGYQGQREIKHSKVWPLVRKLMEECGIRILHIDEAQHGDEITNPVMFQEVENTFKRMMQDSEWLVWIILSGLPELSRFCQNDKSMKRRVRVVDFEPLRFPEHALAVRETVRRIGRACPSIDCETVLTDEFAHRLLHAAMKQFGILIEYVQDAIAECLMAEETALTVGHFADVYSLRTGEMEDAMNVFLARNWESIAVENALYEERLDEGGRPTGGRRLKVRSTRGRAR